RDVADLFVAGDIWTAVVAGEGRFAAEFHVHVGIAGTAGDREREPRRARRDHHSILELRARGGSETSDRHAIAEHGQVVVADRAGSAGIAHRDADDIDDV